MEQEQFDVVIVGAGLSGIGAAYHLQQHCPGKTYAILESRGQMGGTWDLFRYPGIRSDSDMHTLGYKFKPWLHERAIADGPSILDYIRETAAENAIEGNIRYDHRVTGADWDSGEARWTVRVECDGQPRQIKTQFLLMCAGYYRYSEGYTPDFPGKEHYQGTVVHPQLWPEELDYSDKKVIVIGSGATAMTLVPAMADKVEHITMLQRSPTYVVSRPYKDSLNNFLRKILPDKWVYAFTRWKNISWQQHMYKRTRTDPDKIRTMLLDRVRKGLGPDYDIDTHFTPSYSPWDQRLCLIPDDDLYVAINSGKASVVTDEIDHFTEGGILLKSGRELEADIIVTATGLQMVALGEAAFSVDGETVDFANTWTYKGLMISGLPNLVNTFGYINASWTLGSDLTAEYLCQLINHMDGLGVEQVTPQLRDSDRNMQAYPHFRDFSSGYMQRVMHLFPKQGDSEPWVNTQDYIRDRELLGNARFDDGALVFSRAASKSIAA
jgi:monooxygenase